MHLPFLEPKIEAMWLAFFVLFIALCPGVVFTAPSLGKKLGGKQSIVFVHALVFVIIVSLLPDSLEGFQTPRTVPQAQSILAAAQNRLDAKTRNVANITRDIATQVAQIETRSTALNTNKNNLADAQAKAQEANAMVSTTTAAQVQANAQLQSARNAYNAAVASVTSLTGRIANDTNVSQRESLRLSTMRGTLNALQMQVTMDQQLVAKAQADLMNLAAASTMQRASVVQSNAGSAMPSSGGAPTGKWTTPATPSNPISTMQMAVYGSTMQMAVYGEPVSRPPSAGSSVLSAVLGAVGLAGSTPSPGGPLYINGSNYPILTVNNCARGQYALYYNGRNDGTGSSNYMPMCTPCTTVYRPNGLIPVQYDTLSSQNYASFCTGTPGFRP